MISTTKQYDFLKNMATIMVVVGHITRMYTGIGVIQPYNQSVLMGDVAKILYSFHMPLYMCISGLIYGYCIEDMGKYRDIGSFIKNKARRLLVPYAVFGMFIVAPVMTIFHFTDLSFFEYCFWGIALSFDSRHLWFLLTLFLIFVIVAAYRFFIERGERLVHNPVIMAVVLVFGYYMSKYTPGLLCANSVLSNIIFFCIGVALNRYKIKSTKYLKSWHSITISFFLFILSFVSDLNALVTALLAIICIYGMSFHVNACVCESKLFICLKKNGFGLYLFHPMIIYILFYYFGGQDINPLLLCLTVLIMSSITSIFLTKVLRIMKMGAIIGE